MEQNKPKRASGKRPKKRRFYGNQFCTKTVACELFENISESQLDENDNSLSQVAASDSDLAEAAASSLNETASSRKLNDSYFQYDPVSIGTNQCNGNIVIDKDEFFKFVEKNTVCNVCHGKLKITCKRVYGLSSKITLVCQSCQKVEATKNSKLIGGKNIADINRRIIYAMRCIGQGLEPLKTFCAIMDLDPPVTQNAYDKICRIIKQASKLTATESMQNAAKLEAKLSDSTDITVSGDGTWKTRGHTSHIGVCTVIGAESGKVIDVETLSSQCKGCENWKGVRSGSAFNEWQKKHSETCLKNHSGSSGKMECEGMIKIFQRSESERGVRYINYVGDGDSKTFLSIKENNPYKNACISKLECVGHVQKRMGTRLRKLKADFKSKKLSDGKGISGKGRLTDNMINRLSVYYGNAIRQHSDSLKSMRDAVWAAYFHTRSSDEEPLHSFCPPGPLSWCKYQQAVCEGSLKDFSHKDTLPPAIMDVIKPIFNALSQPELLKRCLGAHTQNPNESLNSVIWQMCPKTSGSGRIISEIAVYEAVTVFNEGRKGRLTTMRHLDVHPGMNCISALLGADYKRVIYSKKNMLNTLASRRAKRAAKLSVMRKKIKKEGITYKPGGF